MKGSWMVLFLLSIWSCSAKKAPDIAQSAAKDYCECMTKNNVKADFKNADIICEKQLINKYELVRILMVNIQYNKNADTISDETRRRAAKLSLDLQFAIEKNCCAVAWGCKVDH